MAYINRAALTGLLLLTVTGCAAAAQQSPTHTVANVDKCTIRGDLLRAAPSGLPSTTSMVRFSDGADQYAYTDATGRASSTPAPNGRLCRAYPMMVY